MTFYQPKTLFSIVISLIVIVVMGAMWQTYRTKNKKKNNESSTYFHHFSTKKVKSQYVISIPIDTGNYLGRRNETIWNWIENETMWINVYLDLGRKANYCLDKLKYFDEWKKNCKPHPSRILFKWCQRERTEWENGYYI